MKVHQVQSRRQPAIRHLFVAIAMLIAAVGAWFVSTNAHAADELDLSRMNGEALTGLCKQAAWVHAKESRESWVDVAHAYGEAAGPRDVACVATGVRHNTGSDAPASLERRMWVFVVTLYAGSVVLDDRSAFTELPIP